MKESLDSTLLSAEEVRKMLEALGKVNGE